jgi:AAA ATPase domain
LPTPLRGRDKEVACLREYLGRLRAGRAATWLIEGGAGLGKSRMLEEVISAGRAAGFAVGHGVAEPGDAAVQLAALMNALFDGPGAPLERASLEESTTSGPPSCWCAASRRRA